jgi:hypothetical protein
MEMQMKTNGFAIADGGAINVATVSPGRVGAIVNWLVVKYGIVLPNTVTNDIVSILWDQMGGDAECIEVSIERLS